MVTSVAWGQSSDQPVCTDLSGKIRVRCPGQVSVPTETPAAAQAVSTGAREDSQQKQTSQPTKPASASVVPVRASGPAEPSAADLAEPVPVVVRPTAPKRVLSLERSLPANFVADQRNFWTSPLKLQVQDFTYLLPMAAAITAVNVADPVIERKLPNGASFIRQSKSFSNYGAAAYAGMVGGAYLWSRATRNDHLRETAILSGEAAINTLAVSEFAKYLAGRSRPLEGDGYGGFRNGGSSFPSVHSADAFAIASVVAHEYPGPLTQLLAYGSASAIAAARVTGRQHFASDVLVGGALGWFIGRQVYRAHSDQEERGLYGTFERAPRERGPRDPAYMGSPYVPLDSWVYPAIERLAAMGYIDTAFEGMRPWTRMECARLVEEAVAKMAGGGDQDDVVRSLYDSLVVEFAPENRRWDGQQNIDAAVDSIYERVTGISGMPITDSYHFGETLTNDFGRPYQSGMNAISGFSAHADAGPLTVYIRGEYQHAPAGPALPLAARQSIASVDFMPFMPPDTAIRGIDRFRLLDAYVAVNLDDWQVAVGKQSLWWGPGEGGPMMFSDNAEPIDMVRISRTRPLRLPSMLGWLGPMRTETFFGRLAGEDIIDSPAGLVGQYGVSLDQQPMIHGQRISFKPTRNFEFGFSRTTIFGGQGYPITGKTFLRSLFSTGNAVAGDPHKPGDRRSGLDFSYRLPGLRNWATFYADGLTEDQFSPIAYADRSIWHSGLYFSHLPRLPKLDLRVEGVYSDNPIGGAVGPGYYYYNGTWRAGYTNNGYLIGNWIGRAGQGAQAWGTYHFDARNLVQLNFRHEKISREYLPGGGTITDVGARGDLFVRSGFGLSTVLQYERWNMPVLAPLPQTDVTAAVQLTFRPSKRAGR